MPLAPKPKRSSNLGHTIISEIRDGATFVHILGTPDISGIGQNLSNALGNMLKEHAPKLGFRIVDHD